MPGSEVFLIFVDVNKEKGRFILGSIGQVYAECGAVYGLVFSGGFCEVCCLNKTTKDIFKLESSSA